MAAARAPIETEATARAAISEATMTRRSPGAKPVVRSTNHSARRSNTERAATAMRVRVERARRRARRATGTTRGTCSRLRSSGPAGRRGSRRAPRDRARRREGPGRCPLLLGSLDEEHPVPLGLGEVRLERFLGDEDLAPKRRLLERGDEPQTQRLPVAIEDVHGVAERLVEDVLQRVRVDDGGHFRPRPRAGMRRVQGFAFSASVRPRLAANGKRPRSRNDFSTPRIRGLRGA